MALLRARDNVVFSSFSKGTIEAAFDVVDGAQQMKAGPWLNYILTPLETPAGTMTGHAASVGFSDLAHMDSQGGVYNKDAALVVASLVAANSTAAIAKLCVQRRAKAGHMYALSALTKLHKGALYMLQPRYANMQALLVVQLLFASHVRLLVSSFKDPNTPRVMQHLFELQHECDSVEAAPSAASSGRTLPKPLFVRLLHDPTVVADQTPGLPPQLARSGSGITLTQWEAKLLEAPVRAARRQEP